MLNTTHLAIANRWDGIRSPFYLDCHPATLRLMGECSCQSSVIGHQIQGVSAQGQGAGAFSGCNAKG
ncbi:MAG: hypothetical protein RM049_13540 [Nostoc sp. DedQUE04]|uniref:hypothetical protein n=1 Tax=Nostoc sp. DedQUE04 TaxID=3075390 RepID=UPI002AD2D3C1|nr:hypothetical protein [Nostoc sp. DedQUE04]MDZ8136310.1 hypothetical protein [Nostoc sp. DedQUE04]